MDRSTSTTMDVISETIIEREQVHILVFKTNIRHKKDVKTVGLLLNPSILINRWTIDLEECDKVLRIESPVNDYQKIIALIQHAGYCCEELVD